MDTSPTPRDWMTAGYWATLRGSAPLPMLTNTSPTIAGNVTINATGGALGCVGIRYVYAPLGPGMDLDGSVASEYIFSSTTGGTVFPFPSSCRHTRWSSLPFPGDDRSAPRGGHPGGRNCPAERRK